MDAAAKAAELEVRWTWDRQSLLQAITATRREMELSCQASPDRKSACRTELVEARSRCLLKARRREDLEAMAADRALGAETVLEADFRAKAQVRDVPAQAVDRMRARMAESRLIRVREELATELAERPLCREFPCRVERRPSRCRALVRRMAKGRATDQGVHRPLRITDSKLRLRQARVREEFSARAIMEF
jgi:hypothetical protein